MAEFPDRPMTTDTLFSTCSTTKAFTAAAVSMTIQDSSHYSPPLNWDTPVSSIIRDDFVLADDHPTSHTTLEDALSHRTGLSGHFGAMRWARPDESLRDAVRKLRHLPLAYSPRSSWDYCNHMYMVVSHALEKVTGIELGALLKKRIWDPLGMNDTYFSIQDVVRSPLRSRVAQGYSWVGDSESFTPEPYMNYAPTTGTGAMVSTVLEYTKWLRALIYKSSPLSPVILDPLVTPRSIILPSEDTYPPGPYHLYALGWFVENYAGEQFYWHSGSWPGFGIMVGFVPSREFGFAIMGNTVDARLVGKAMYMRLMEKMLGLGDGPQGLDSPEPSKWSKPSTPTTNLHHSLPLEDYAGSYIHPAYGRVTFHVRPADGKTLSADLMDRTIATRLDLEHRNGEFFTGTLYTPGGGGEGTSSHEVEFYIDSTGRVQRVGMDLERPLKGRKIWFERL